MDLRAPKIRDRRPGGKGKLRAKSFFAPKFKKTCVSFIPEALWNDVKRCLRDLRENGGIFSSVFVFLCPIGEKLSME